MIDSLYDEYKRWSQKGSIYLIGDLHFNDEKCHEIDPNWVSSEEQISIINKLVTKNDTLIVLGDVGDKELIKNLNGYKVLIMGNHDKGKANYKDLFAEVFEGPLFIASWLLLSHEPLPGKCYVNLHGHDHNNTGYENCINLCSNVINYTPVSLGVLIKTGIKVDDIHRLTIEKRNG